MRSSMLRVEAVSGLENSLSKSLLACLSISTTSGRFTQSVCNNAVMSCVSAVDQDFLVAQPSTLHNLPPGVDPLSVL